MGRPPYLKVNHRGRAVAVGVLQRNGSVHRIEVAALGHAVSPLARYRHHLNVIS